MFGDPLQNGVVMQRGNRGVGGPLLVTYQGDVLFCLDDANKLWRAEGDQVKDVTPSDHDTWKSASAIAVFTSNLYVLDAASGQLWKHESGDALTFGKATAYLSVPPAANTALSLAIDGDVWIVTTSSEIMRFRRNPLLTTAARIDFTPRWQAAALHPTQIQAAQTQTNIYLLDAVAHTVVQMGKDGRELLRIALPASLPQASAFYVSEVARVVYTVHGSKIVATSFDH